MIPFPTGWRRRILGDAIALYPPEGTHLGGIGYQERIRPLAPVALVVEQLIARSPEFTDPVVGRIVPLVTDEGEYAAYVRITCKRGGAPVQRDLGLVFGDDFYALISGVALAPEQFDRFATTVRDLTLHDSHDLGVRRRRFLYQPPPGWDPIARGLETDWLAPGFPRDASVITVLPATPAHGRSPASMFEALLAQDRADGETLDYASPADPISPVPGLHGSAWEVLTRRASGERRFRDLAVLADAGYLYHARLDSHELESRLRHRAVLAKLVQSVRPIPQRRTPADLGALASYSE